MAFASSVLLGDLNDFIAPSQACILPDTIENSLSDSKNLSKPKKISLELELDTNPINSLPGLDEYQEPNIIKTKLKKGKTKKIAQVSLTDCLACSGCVTSAETILIEQQSKAEFLNLLEKAEPSENIVIIISTQSLSNLAVDFDLSLSETLRLVTAFMKSLSGKITKVVSSSPYENKVLALAQKEFVSALDSKTKLGDWNAPEETLGYSTSRIKQVSSGQVIKNHKEFSAKLPVITSSCPGWICYVEKQYPEVIPYLSSVVSAQQAAPYYLSKEFQNAKIVQVQPCPDKKLEASRKDFFSERLDKQEVDLVLTTTEVKELLIENNFDFVEQLKTLVVSDADEQRMERLFQEGKGSGGYLDYIFRSVAKEKFGVDVSKESLPMKKGRNKDFESISLSVKGERKLNFARVYGFRNIQAIIRQLKRGKCAYDFIEIMACPGGCLNGGGQIKAKEEVSVVEYLESQIKKYNDRPLVKGEAVLALEDKENVEELLTQYHNIPKLDNPLMEKW
eukprot:snap_masked-scaffold_1-processed-gene-23.48-mRNA-1 protein AED:0.35 eAED:0.35 QI:0/-1/0/1/-1/1/1/0/506